MCEVSIEDGEICSRGKKNGEDVTEDDWGAGVIMEYGRLGVRK